jgi:hypothetical protein
MKTLAPPAYDWKSLRQARPKHTPMLDAQHEVTQDDDDDRVDEKPTRPLQPQAKSMRRREPVSATGSSEASTNSSTRYMSSEEHDHQNLAKGGCTALQLRTHRDNRKVVNHEQLIEDSSQSQHTQTKGKRKAGNTQNCQCFIIFNLVCMALALILFSPTPDSSLADQEAVSTPISIDLGFSSLSSMVDSANQILSMAQEDSFFTVPIHQQCETLRIPGDHFELSTGPLLLAAHSLENSFARVLPKAIRSLKNSSCSNESQSKLTQDIQHAIHDSNSIIAVIHSWSNCVEGFSLMLDKRNEEIQELDEQFDKMQWHQLGEKMSLSELLKREHAQYTMVKALIGGLSSTLASSALLHRQLREHLLGMEKQMVVNSSSCLEVYERVGTLMSTASRQTFQNNTQWEFVKEYFTFL